MSRAWPRSPSAAATVGLVLVTAVWGSTFIVVKDAVDRMPVMDFLAWRFCLAALVMAVIRPGAVRRLSPAARRHGLLLGAALAAGYVAQTFGLTRTPATVSGFITGLFVVFTPLCAGLLLRRPVSGPAWAAVALATVGLGLLSLHGLTVGTGEAITLLCAVSFALHIVGLGEWSTATDAYGLAVLQLVTVGVVSALAAAPETLRPPPDGGVWFAILLTALAATALAFLVQTWAQAHLPPTRAAVIMTMEPVFAGVFGVAVGGDRLSPRTVAGALLVLAAMYLVELGPRHGADAAVERLEV
ncbi:MAG TPA: DMT family transporter [Mycobacteriales bacterium]|nr:DMT family transporter [Mycobacteriales bacterium]